MNLLARKLAERIVAEGGLTTLASNVLDFLSEQSLEALTLLEDKSAGYSRVQWMALGIYISNHVDDRVPDLATEQMPYNDFSLKAALSLLPMYLELILMEPAPERLEWAGSDPDESIAHVVANEIECMVQNMEPDELSVELCRGYYLNGRYGSTDISEEDFRWISEHTMELVPHIQRVFGDGGFSRDFAEQMISVDSVPLISGLL